MGSRDGEVKSWRSRGGSSVTLLPPSIAQGSRKGAGFELSRSMGPDFTPDLSLEKDVQMSSLPCRGMVPESGPAALRDRFLGAGAKAMCSLGGSGYANRSTKMALAVVWPKMKAPRVTRRTP